MERDDLRRWQVNSANAAGGSGWWAEVSDADLASLGYVRLDGIDVEALRDALRKDPEAYPANGPLPDLAYAYLDALAAIDQADGP